MPWKSQRRVLAFVTCELLKDGTRKNPKTIERDILAIHFPGEEDGLSIAKKLAERKGQGLTKRERTAGDALLSALREDPIEHTAQKNLRLELAWSRKLDQSKKLDCESSADERIGIGLPDDDA